MLVRGSYPWRDVLVAQRGAATFVDTTKSWGAFWQSTEGRASRVVFEPRVPV